MYVKGKLRWRRVTCGLPPANKRIISRENFFGGRNMLRVDRVIMGPLLGYFSYGHVHSFQLYLV